MKIINNTLSAIVAVLFSLFIVSCGSDDSSSDDLLPINNKPSGKFQINAEGKKVCFAPGNLQATYDGSTWNWSFAKNQWDYIGDSGANIFINGEGTVSAIGTVDLFGWVGESSLLTGAAQYGICNTKTVNSRYTYGNVTTENLLSDWGTTISDGYKWRTLSWSEWKYVVNNRPSGSTINSTANARFTYATINTDVRAVNGMILFPDGITIEDSDAASWGKINDTSVYTKCTSSQWQKLAARGCVFLPAAGYRFESSVREDGYGLYYWSSSSYPSSVYSAFALSYDSSYLNAARSYSRPYGFSVRLVREVE